MRRALFLRQQCYDANLHEVCDVNCVVLTMGVIGKTLENNERNFELVFQS